MEQGAGSRVRKLTADSFMVFLHHLCNGNVNLSREKTSSRGDQLVEAYKFVRKAAVQTKTYRCEKDQKFFLFRFSFLT